MRRLNQVRDEYRDDIDLAVHNRRLNYFYGYNYIRRPLGPQPLLRPAVNAHIDLRNRRPVNPTRANLTWWYTRLEGTSDAVYDADWRTWRHRFFVQSAEDETERRLSYERLVRYRIERFSWGTGPERRRMILAHTGGRPGNTTWQQAATFWRDELRWIQLYKTHGWPRSGPTIRRRLPRVRPTRPNHPLIPVDNY